MKCPKCGFNSFEYLDSCKKCGNDLAAFKASLGIQPVVMPPGVFLGQAAISEGVGGEDSFIPETSAIPASAADEFEFETTSVAPAEASAMVADDAAFGEISFDDTVSEATTPGWSGDQADSFSSGQEFEGFNTDPVNAPKDDTLANMFGKDEAKAVEKKTDPDDFFNSPELADLFKGDTEGKK
jgi:hypothetical protein